MIGNYVYCFYDTDKNLLYIGKTTGLKNRMRSHFSADSLELDQWKKLVDKQYILVHPCSNPTDLDLYETYFINKFNPIYNKDKVFNHLPTIEFPYIEPIVYSIEENTDTKGSFKDQCIKYITYPEHRLEISKETPIIEQAFNVLGLKRMKALSYNLPRIKIELEYTSTTTSEKILTELVSNLKLDTEYIASDVKDLLNNIYRQLNLNKNAKSTDIDKYFELERRTKRYKGVLKNILILNKVK